MNVRGIGLWMLCYLALTAAMYFDLGEQEEKWLIEEIPGNMLVTDINEKKYGRFGKFTFTSHASGSHWLCMQSNSTLRFSIFASDSLVSSTILALSLLDCVAPQPYLNIFLISPTQRIHFDVQMGEHSVDPSAERHKDTVQTIEYSLKHLRDQMNERRRFARSVKKPIGRFCGGLLCRLPLYYQLDFGKSKD
ncbi:unnamed protein product [Coregonus sp. 'balchen']|nr:unnamed protein product [Coregonus sp. 'balchen']